MWNPHSDRPVILVTGGGGYIGSRLIRDLAADPRFPGCTVRIYDNLLHNNYAGLMDLPAGGSYEFIEGDVLDRINLQRAMQGASVVVHLAAIVKTPMSFDHPAWTVQINHWGTASVVECALTAGVPKLVHVSSASVYGPDGPFDESAQCHPIGPYAVSKHKGEEEVMLGRERGLDAVIVRLGTVFGYAPAMRYDGVANRFAYLVGVGRPLTIHGSGEQRRPLIHVQDASEALRVCMVAPEAVNEMVNVATANPSVNEVAAIMQAIVPGAAVHRTDQDVLTKLSFSIDIGKMTTIGFAPRFDLETGLREMLSHWQHIRPALAGAASFSAEDL